MNFKITVIFIFFTSISFSQSKWNVIVANWKDLSNYKDKSLSSMLKSSIYNQLKKENSFNVINIEESITINSTTEAHNICLSNKGDVIIYGYYYVEGRSIYVITEIWDSLKKKIKMRNKSKGVVTIDIFDTIDEISLNTKKMVKEVLPELSFEEETEVKKLRQVIYEKEEIKIERKFYTKFGFYVDIGEKNIVGDPYQNFKFEGSYPLLSPIVGFMIRYWDFRVDFYGGPMPGWPIYNFNGKKFLLDETPDSYLNFSLSYYLPFFNKQFAFGTGIMMINFINEIYFKNNETNLSGNNIFANLPFCFTIIWNPNKNFEFSLSSVPFINQYLEYSIPEGNEYKKVEYFFPFSSISCAYFINKEVGFELSLSLANYYFVKGQIVNSENYTKTVSRSTIFNILASFIYRVDYSELGKNGK